LDILSNNSLKLAGISEIKRRNVSDKINELAMNSKNKNIRHLCRGINGFKKGYQPRSNLMRSGNGDL
jgi:hypothetical protein